ncbi:GAF and ANTAR domain-containing protein [Pseudonocardia sp. Cha107L01]|uniref:GAF and ANTAR domain-containing protein n=1 Tax=Pseudonocardia sp. Cha107L01 TaxID=3457576 RepID=UPI00403EF1D4
MIEYLGRELAQRMSELAIGLRIEDNRDGTLRAIVHGALELVPGARWAGICLIQGKRVTLEASSHDLVVELDQLQSDFGEGPCVSAIRQQRAARVTDLAEPDQPWPRFAAAALERGVRSMMSLRLSVCQETLGALNLYAAQPDAFAPDAQIVAELLAQHSAVALAGATREHHLNAALVNRDVLGQANGVLMQRDRLTALQAFRLLVRASQDANMKIADVARWLITETENNARDQHPTGFPRPPSQPRPATTGHRPRTMA